MLTISHAISNSDSESSLIPFITAGYPNLDATRHIVELLDSQGVQAIEIGLPYSDALADGFVIQESSRVALQEKTYLGQVLQLVNVLSKNIETPIIIFTYLNLVLSQGIEIFMQRIAESGVKGLVVPDLPLEESDYFIAIAGYYDIELILFVAPSSSDKRIHEIILKAPGCIYLVSSYGVTGTRDYIDPNIKYLVNRIKSLSDKQIILGFGISNELQVNQIVSSDLHIDAIVMGTAFINKIKQAHNEGDYTSVGLFCSRLKGAMICN